MQVQQKSVTTAKSAKDYLSKNEIPQLFECLMTGLMYHRPVDYIHYLQECLEKIKKQGVSAVHWDMFLESKKTPLPPIAAAPKEDYRPEPLPEIGSLHLKISLNSTIVIIQGGPGIGKSEFCHRICSDFSEFCHINLKSLLKQRAIIEEKDLNSKWKNINNIIDDGGFAPEDFVLEILIKELNNNCDKENFVIDGYPRTMVEKQDFERLIGVNKLKFMILIDCEEELCKNNILNRSENDVSRAHSHKSITKRISNYKLNTLAICKYFDDQGKLKVIEGDTTSDLVYHEIHKLFHKEFRDPDVSPKFESDNTRSNLMTPENNVEEEIAELSDILREQERNSDLPQNSIILFLGGPGSGKTEIATHLCKKYSGWVHVDVNETLRMKVINTETPDMNIGKISNEDDHNIFVENFVVNVEAIKDMLKAIDSDTKVIILEGFPKNKDELNLLNTEIGKVDLVILFDSEEESLKSRLKDRFLSYGFKEDDETNSEMRLQYFRQNGLPLCRYFDERCHLNIVTSDKDTLYIIEDVEKIASSFIDNENNSESIADGMMNQQNNSNTVNESAVITIQASFRGHLTRKRLKETRGTNNKDNLEDEKEMLNDDVNEEENVELTEDINVEISNEQILNEVDVVEEIVEEKEQEDVDNIENIIEPQVAFQEGHRGVRTHSQMELRNAYVILLLGGPGSGKKSLGDHLVIKYGMSFIHVDQLISSEINSNSENAESLNQCIESNYEDITPILALLRKNLVHSMDVSKIIIVAGFPKTFEQYQWFVDDVTMVSGIIYIDVDSDTMQSRLESEADPDFATSVTDQIQDFQDKTSCLIEQLSSLEIFRKINGTGTIEEVLVEASEIIDNYSFMNTNE